jgi:hypothetical protein
MARGWESKSVESQIEDARSKAGGGAPLTPEQREAKRKLQGLELSRRRVLREIEETRSPNRRTALQQALELLDAEIGKIK